MSNHHDSELIEGILNDIEVTITHNSKHDAVVLSEVLSSPTDTNSAPLRDKTKYIINHSGQKLGKGRFVLELISRYVNNHPTDFESLKILFKDKLQGSTGVINRLDYVEVKYANKSDKRHFIGKDEILTSSDGVKFVVCTEWGKFNIDAMVQLGRELGFSIEETE